MILTSISLVSIWGGEVSPTLDSAPIICYPIFNFSHLNPPPDLPLTPKSSIYCLPQSTNRNHLPPVDISFDVNPVRVWPLKYFFRSFLCFCTQQFLIPNSPSLKLSSPTMIISSVQSPYINILWFIFVWRPFISCKHKPITAHNWTLTCLL